MKEYFESRNLEGEIKIALPERNMVWTSKKEEIVAAIRETVRNYAGMGYRLTLRQLYYQLVQSNTIPNHDKVYAKLSGILDDCRYSGKVDWDLIEDRGRVPKLPYAVEDIADAVKDTIEQFRLDRQKGQSQHIELWTEKDAISNILYRVTSKYHVRLVINKGYTSSSAAYNAYERFVEHLQAGRSITILYFGDHDPSGLDMIRDIRDRMLTFLSRGERLRGSDNEFHKAVDHWWTDEAGYSVHDLVDAGYMSERQAMRLFNSDDPPSELIDLWEAGKFQWYIESKGLFKVIPIGLTMDQVKKYKLPHNPAKITDPRAKNYIRQFGQKSWEVDALRPEVLTDLVDKSIVSLMDATQFNKVIADEQKQKKKLSKFIKLK